MNLLAYFKQRESWEEEEDRRAMTSIWPNEEEDEKTMTEEITASSLWLAEEMFLEREMEDERSNRRTHADRLVRDVPAGV